MERSVRGVECCGVTTWCDGRGAVWTTRGVTTRGVV